MNNQTFVSSPLRLSLFGGGTDIPSIFKRIGKGISITASLEMPVTVGTVTRPLDKGVKLKYSSNEIAYDLESIIHPIFKETLRYFEYNFENEKGLEILSTAPIPSGSGLGSSAAFTTSLVKCLSFHLRNKVIEDKELLMIATDIEHKSGNNQIGYQDQVASIFGSITKANYYEDDVQIMKVPENWEKGITKLIEERGFLFKTTSRTGISSNYIKTQKAENELKMYEKVLTIAENINFEKDDFNENKLIDLLCETSSLAKRMKTRSKEIEDIQNQLNKLGAIYSKQMGAGGGGFIFSLFDDKNPVFPKNLKEIMLRPKISKRGASILTI